MSALGGQILVTGGCGFLGHALVRALLKEPDHGPIYVVSRNPTKYIEEGVQYRAGSVADRKFIDALFDEIRPQIVFHAASPWSIDPNVKAREFHNTNVNGTNILLECSKKCPATKAFVYTSSVNVSAGAPHINLDETAPLWQPNSNAMPYWRSKAEAERHVLAVNGEGLKTVSLRLPVIIGPEDHAMIPLQLDAYEQKRTNIQLGDGKNLLSCVSTENASRAHILAANALVSCNAADAKVHGEAFHITDGEPIGCWDMARIIWDEAGGAPKPEEVTVIPAWLAMMLAAVLEYGFWIATLGYKESPLTMHVAHFCTTEYTYSIEKARRLLKHEPVGRTEDVLRKATRWELARRRGGG